MELITINGNCAKLNKDFTFIAVYKTGEFKKSKVMELKNLHTDKICEPHSCHKSLNCEAYANAREKER